MEPSQMMHLDPEWWVFRYVMQYHGTTEEVIRRELTDAAVRTVCRCARLKFFGSN